MTTALTQQDKHEIFERREHQICRLIAKRTYQDYSTFGQQRWEEITKEIAELEALQRAARLLPS